MSQAGIELKGSSFTLSVLHISTTDFSELRQALAAKIDQAPKFFEMAPIVANIEPIAEQDSIDFVALKNALESLKLVPVGITGATDQHKAAAKEAGLAIMIAAKANAAENQANAQPVQKVVERVEVPVIEKVKVEVPVEVKVPEYIPAMQITQNVRSGQQVYAKDTDLIIIGSVGNGGEVIADGNIHIYGSLRGKAMAGAKGDSNAKIYCHNIQAELISINGTYWTSEQLQQHCWQKAGCIELDGEQLSVKALTE
ncbi:septum site-determining protein MinC [Saccharobesus litoralis]|uniref:Probable septum site-determining protein MinC n=1 Tax=Saccharobesus litoralis TaxID=2172099 RepID=A0A2S0VUN5_9ALTE|nr:septum site-determining protein MinC [Saccharobesus litoralis]AWB67931.1 septum site-determining protein MinC [Saccharobesus litoralis]